MTKKVSKRHQDRRKLEAATVPPETPAEEEATPPRPRAAPFRDDSPFDFATLYPDVKLGGLWHGLQVYLCQYCHFDSLAAEDVQKHAREAHVQRRPSLILGLDGEPAGIVETRPIETPDTGRDNPRPSGRSDDKEE